MATNTNAAPTVKPAQLETALECQVRAAVPVLVLGPPGIGKSEIAAEAARRAGCRVITLQPTTHDRCDTDGLPAQIAPDRAAWLPYAHLVEIREATPANPLCVILDDMGHAPPPVQLSWMHLINGARPGCTYILTANNADDPATGAYSIPSPLLDRVAVYNLQADVNDWLRWAWAAGIERPVLLAVAAHGAADPKTNAEMPATPRSLKLAARTLGAHSEAPAAVRLAAVQACTGNAALSQAVGVLAGKADLLWRAIRPPVGAETPTLDGMLACLAGDAALAAILASAYGRLSFLLGWSQVAYRDMLGSLPAEYAPGELVALYVRCLEVTRAGIRERK